MKLIEYFTPLLKWWWLLVVAVVIATSSAYLFARDLPPVYNARTTLMIGRTFMDPNPSSTELGLSQQLTQAYADIAQREPVRDATKKALGLANLPKYEAGPIPGTPFLEISVTHTNPQLAQAVAAELANQLLLRSPTNLQQDEQSRQQFVDQQISKIEADIKQTEADIARNQDALGNMNSAVDIAKTQDEIKALETKLSSLQSIYASMLSNTQQGALNTLSILEPAALPTTPIGPNKILIISMAAISGFLLAVGAAYLIEFMDDSFRSSEEVARVLNLSILGRIPTLPKGKNSGVYVVEQPLSPLADAFRTLRANLKYSQVDKPLKTILVTSPDASEGKSTVASNLAAVLAQGEKKTVLLDADLRRPSLHNILEIENQPGLSDFFRDGLDISEIMKTREKINVPLITAGDPPPNPSELLGSKKMDQFLKDLGAEFEIIVIDGAPFIVADALMLAAKVDGVLIVIRPGITRKAVARAMLEGLNQVGANVVGVILNRLPAHTGNYYYPGYAKYYKSEDKDTHDGWLKKTFLRLTGSLPKKSEPADEIPRRM